MNAVISGKTFSSTIFDKTKRQETEWTKILITDSVCPESFHPWGFLKAFWASYRLPYYWYYLLSPQEAPKSFQEAPRKLKNISGQKSLQYFRCYFGRKDDTKKTFRNYLTFSYNCRFKLYMWLQCGYKNSSSKFIMAKPLKWGMLCLGTLLFQYV